MIVPQFDFTILEITTKHTVPGMSNTTRKQSVVRVRKYNYIDKLSNL